MPNLRVMQPKRRVSPATVEQFRVIPAAVISDSMSRLTAGGASLRPRHAGGTVLAGPAFTVKTRPGDNLFVHKAIDTALPGDIIVVDAGGDCTNAIVGEMMLTHAETRGLAGVVIYGAIRDSGHVKNHPFPVFAAGITHRGPYHDGPGEINVAIAIDGMVIQPGDLMIGDDDGLMCIPFDETELVYKEAAKRLEGENAQRQRVRNGTVDRKWIDDCLAKIDFKVDYL
ncbi:MAG TPA: RraA family protein [Devosiaceae bacterium]